MIELVHKYVTPGTAVKISGQFEALVRSGKFPAESLLPPVREVARALQVSPGTVAAAYKSLRDQGLVTTDRRRGTRVLPPSVQREYVDAPPPSDAVDLQVANPDPALLPDLKEAFSSLDARSGLYGGDHFDPDLQRWAANTFEADGIPSTHLTVTSGAISALHGALRTCLKPGAKVAVEDPGFNDHHACVSGLFMVAVPVSVDDEGMRPDSLDAALRKGATAVILSPRFQSPMGAALTSDRAAKLRSVLASHPEVLVLVDDYASLLAAWPYRSCIGKEHARWLVVRSFNKAVAPDLRVGVAAGDAETVDRMRRDLWLTAGWVSVYLQKCAAKVIALRSTRSLLVRAQKTYEQRRQSLLAELSSRGIRAHGVTGLNVWIPVADEAAVLQGMLTKGWCVRSGARYRLQSGPAVRLTVAQLLPEAAQRVASDLEGVLRRRVGKAP